MCSSDLKVDAELQEQGAFEQREIAKKALRKLIKDQPDLGYQDMIDVAVAAAVVAGLNNLVWTDTPVSQENYFETAVERMDAAGPDEMGAQMSDFMCQVLNTVLLDGALAVTDLDGQVPSTENNFLLSDDGKQFQGLVTLATGETVEFTIFEKANGNWAAEIPCFAIR